nr:transporter substrate-binding domain-containing protein [Photobacterium sp. OFAV2-7]
MTSSELEDKFEPVRFPVYKGLLGNRIFIIRQGEQHRYDAINTFADLQRFTAGQGKLWPDTQILQSGNITVRTTMDYENLFYMLEGGRFDYFPRGIHEPFQEVEARPELNLVVEDNLMLVYRAPMYFFVRKDNKQLAERIHQGLDKALEDGSFDEFFFSNAMIQDVLSKANIKQRNVFFISNPLLTPQTPLDRKEYWLNIEDL